MNDEAELLRRYAEEGAEGALAEVVRRRVDLVYGAAWRQVRGNATLAEDVTQAVFTELARKAGSLARHELLVGWLHTATRFAAAKAMRAEGRRRAREREAWVMSSVLGADEAAAEWERLRPVIDAALGELKERERAAILLRYFEQRPLAEVGAALALSETAARSCVDRALDKLHAALARRGITSTAAALGVALAGQATMAAPAGVAASATAAALAGAGAGGLVGGAGWGIFMSMTKLQVGIAGAVAVAGVAGYGWQAETNAGLRRELAAVREQQQAVAALTVENQRLASVAAEVAVLRRDDAELQQLAQRAAEVKALNEAKARVAQTQARVEERRKVLERQMQEKDRSAQDEIDRLNREGNALVKEYKALSAGTKNAELAPDVRAELDVAAKAKFAEIQAKQKELQDFIKRAKAELAQSPEMVELRGLPPGPSGTGAESPTKRTGAGRLELRGADSRVNGAGSAAPAGPGEFRFVPGPKPASQP